MNNVPVSAADDAGTCDVLNCTHDSKPCRGDSDCCHGSCDWTLDGGSLPGVCSDANRIVGGDSIEARKANKVSVRYYLGIDGQTH